MVEALAIADASLGKPRAMVNPACPGVPAYAAIKGPLSLRAS
jgi:hypothetical protein